MDCLGLIADEVLFLSTQLTSKRLAFEIRSETMLARNGQFWTAANLGKTFGFHDCLLALLTRSGSGPPVHSARESVEMLSDVLLHLLYACLMIDMLLALRGPR